MSSKLSLRLSPATLFTPIDGSFAAYFRIVFGLITFVDVVLHLAGGAVEHVWAAPRIHFKYYGFEWVQALPGAGMHWLFAALGPIAVCHARILLSA